jgi:hypothetical protein
MKRISIILLSTALALVVFATGCARPPTTEMQNATEWVTRAENDRDAVTYAVNSIIRAKDALARMNAEADSKNYDSAKAHAAEAVAAAERAINEGRTGAARDREEAATLVSQLKPMVAETEQGINASRAAGMPLDYAAINSEFDNAKYNVNEAQTAFSNNRYQESVTRGRNARAELSDINQKLSNATLSTSRKK